MKELYLDLETTGLNSYRNGIWQIAAILYEEGEEKEEFNEVCNIFSTQECHPKALEMASLTEESLKDFNPPKEAYRQFKALLEKYIDPFNKQDKMFMYGYNVRFDDDFLRQFFYNNQDRFYGSYFWNPAIDIMNLAMEKLKNQRPLMRNFKQGTVARSLDIEIEEEKLHDALYDIRVSREIHKKLGETA